MITLMDCTLRDGANVVGKGFSAEITDMVLDGLTACHVPIIELGNAGGIGAYEVADFTNAETDQTYLDIAQKYLDRGSQLGMFLNAKRYREKNVALARESGLSFLRVGADAGDGDISLPAIRDIKKAGLKAFYSAMKAYLLTPGQLAEEAKRLADAGLDEITIMDSAGTMLPGQVAEYTRAGNLATEMCVAIMQRYGQMKDIDLYGMLDFIDQRLQPAMDAHSYHNPVPPLDLVLGLSGCHSSFLKKFKTAAQEYQVNLYRLIVEVSALDRKAPSDELIAKTAAALQ